MHKENFKRFFDTYVPALADSMQSHPAEYGLRPDQVTDHIVAQTANMMRLGFHRKTYNKDGRAIRATCRALGLKHTYAAINEYIGHSGPIFTTNVKT
jgi:hypothetical protein